MTILTRWLSLCVAVLATWFGLGSVATAAVEPAPSPIALHAYDYPHHAAATAHTTIVRGPPTAHDSGATYSGADYWSRDASARQSGGADGPATAYTAPQQVLHDAPATGTTTRHARNAGGDLRALPGARVAANAAPRALNASTRVAPWAGSTLSRLSREGEVMYRVYGGGAGKAGSWLTPINPVSSAAARQGLALPAENAALYVSKVTLPGGVRMQVGTAGSAFGQPGGWAQAQLLERIPLSSFGKGVPLQ